MDISGPLQIPKLFSADGLVVVVTGGGTGIGLGFAAALHQTGAHKVYILGRRIDVLNTAAESLDKSKQVVVPLQCDVTDPSSIDAVVKQIEKDVGYVDVLINNAGVSGPNHKAAYSATSIADLQTTLLSDWSGWQSTFDINTAAVLGVSAAFLHLLDAANARRGWETGKMWPGERGRERSKVNAVGEDDLRTSQIITVSSIAAFNRHITAGVAYSASKAGAVSIGKTLANMLSPWGIRSNIICPGIFPSEMTVGTKAEFPYDEIPAHRQGTFDEIASTVLYLVGKSGAYSNGNVQIVDGGRLSIFPATY